jgi:hypothetical protein
MVDGKGSYLKVFKENIAMVLLSFALLISFAILMVSFKGDKDWVRTSMAGFSFIGFSCLFAVLIFK